MNNYDKAIYFLKLHNWHFDYIMDTWNSKSGFSITEESLESDPIGTVKRFYTDAEISAFIVWDGDDLTILPKEDEKDTKQNICFYHAWLKYTGLNETFYFCTRCDAKKDSL